MLIGDSTSATAQVSGLQMPLDCTFRTVQSGQFHGVDFAAGPSSGVLTLTVAAAPLDLRLGRAAILEDERASVVALTAEPRRTTLVGHDDTMDTLLTVFPAGANDLRMPAALSRYELIGSVPIIIQGTGTCEAPEAQP